MTLSVLVVGCGSIGRRHLANLRSLGITELLAFDPVDERRLSAQRELGAKACETFEAGLNASPNAVLVCTPAHLHTSLALQAIRAKAHVFIEKPLSHQLDGIAQLLTEASQQKVGVTTGYNLRFHGGVKHLKHVIEAGAIGEILSIRAEFGQHLAAWHPQEDYRRSYLVRESTGGGIILDASHELDYVRWLAGEVEGVSAMAGHLSELEMETEDTALILLRLAHGGFAEIHVDCVQRGYSRSCKVIGSRGTLIWDFAGGVRRVASDGMSHEELAGPIPPNQMYVDEMAHFLACVRGEAEPLVNGQEGFRVLQIALAAKEAARLRREVTV